MYGTPLWQTADICEDIEPIVRAISLFDRKMRDRSRKTFRDRNKQQKRDLQNFINLSIKEKRKAHHKERGENQSSRPDIASSSRGCAIASQNTSAIATSDSNKCDGFTKTLMSGIYSDLFDNSSQNYQAQYFE